MRVQTGYKIYFYALLKAFVVNLAISAVWYGLEWEQYHELQWDRNCDNIVGFLYLMVLWYLFLKSDTNLMERRKNMECVRCEYFKEHNCNHQCMMLPEGKTCADCIHSEKCTNMFGAKYENTSCGFEPVRFHQKFHL